MPGVVTCTQVLQAIALGHPDRGGQYDDVRDDRPIRPDRRPAGLGASIGQTIKDAGLKLELQPIEKWEFYKAVATTDHVLTIQTADQQRFANLLLTVGVRMD